MNILVTGANGQLGCEMQRLGAVSPNNYIFTDVAELDITNADAVMNAVKAASIDIIVNCAAYTAVDKAEDDEATATKVNVDAVRNLGAVATKYGIKLVHISTDYVFDGKSFKPYTEDVAVCPTNVYGRTKLAGEEALFEQCKDAIIIRTSWLYSSFGNNFVKTMLRLSKAFRQSLLRC